MDLRSLLLKRNNLLFYHRFNRYKQLKYSKFLGNILLDFESLKVSKEVYKLGSGDVCIN